MDRRNLTQMIGASLLPLAAAAVTRKAAAAEARPAAAGVAVHKRLARRYFEEMWNRLDAAVAAEIVAADVVGHVNSGAPLRGLEVLRTRMASLSRVYARMRFTVEDVIGEQDRVVVRWTQEGQHSGALGPATAGKAFKVSGVNVFRFAGGRIAEIWVVSDDLGELEQVGALKAPQGL